MIEWIMKIVKMYIYIINKGIQSFNLLNESLSVSNDSDCFVLPCLLIKLTTDYHFIFPITDFTHLFINDSQIYIITQTSFIIFITCFEH